MWQPPSSAFARCVIFVRSRSSWQAWSYHVEKLSESASQFIRSRTLFVRGVGTSEPAIAGESALASPFLMIVVFILRVPFALHPRPWRGVLAPHVRPVPCVSAHHRRARRDLPVYAGSKSSSAYPCCHSGHKAGHPSPAPAKHRFGPPVFFQENKLQ